MLPVRVFFKKHGSSVYVSHLDLQRAVFRAINRSGVRPVYTEGFNPHIKLTFASPLSVYQKSEYEIFDFFSADDLPYGEITEKLRAAFPEGLEITGTAAPVSKLSALALADYEIRFTTAMTAKELEEKLSGSMVVIKKSKKGPHPEDLSGLMKSKSYTQGEGFVTMRLRASCGSGEHLNVKYICDFLGDLVTSSDITRLNMLDEAGKLLV